MRDVHTAERQNNLVEIQRRLSEASGLSRMVLLKIHEACRRQRAVVVRDTGTDPGANQKERMSAELLEKRKQLVSIRYDYETWDGDAGSHREVLRRALEAFRVVVEAECMPELDGVYGDPAANYVPQEEFVDGLYNFIGEVEGMIFGEEFNNNMPWGSREVK